MSIAVSEAEIPQRRSITLLQAFNQHEFPLFNTTTVYLSGGVLSEGPQDLILVKKMTFMHDLIFVHF